MACIIGLEGSDGGGPKAEDAAPDWPTKGGRF